MAYDPLVLPSMPDNADFSDTASFLAETASKVTQAAQSFITSLSDLNNIEFNQVGDLPSFNSVVFFGTVPGVLTRPARPTVDTNVTDLLAQLRNLAAPVAPTTAFNYHDPGYSSGLQAPLFEKLLTDLINGGYGIDTNDEIALWNRERDREELLAQANVEELKRQASSTGFPMPQGALFNALAKARQEHMAKISSVNRDIGLKRADLYVLNRRQVIEQVLNSETQTIGLYNAVQNRALQAAQAEVQMALSLFDAGIKLFDTRIRGISEQIQGVLEAARATVQIYASDVQAYASFVNAVVSAAQIDIANSKNLLTRDIASHQARVDIIRFRLEQLKTTVSMREDIDKFGAEYFRTALGSAMSGISGLAVENHDV